MRHRRLQRRASLRHRHRNGASEYRSRIVCAADGCILQGVPPVSLAEWTLGVDGKPDFYDVSLVNGSNLPMRITSNKGCPTASCPVDLNPACKSNNPPTFLPGVVLLLFMCGGLGPPELALRNSNGVVVGCKSSCFANLSGDPGIQHFSSAMIGTD